VYPSTNKSPISTIRVTRDIEKRTVEVRNISKERIYVYVDCNYRTKKFGGGYDRKTAALPVRPGSQQTFILHVPKGERIAIRWTENKNVRAANWYETNYFNKTYTHIEVKTGGHYLKTIKVTGKKIPHAFWEKANMIKFVSSYRKLPATPQPKAPAPPRPRIPAPPRRPESI